MFLLDGKLSYKSIHAGNADALSSIWPATNGDAAPNYKDYGPTPKVSFCDDTVDDNGEYNGEIKYGSGCS